MRSTTQTSFCCVIIAALVVAPALMAQVGAHCSAVQGKVPGGTESVLYALTAVPADGGQHTLSARFFWGEQPLYGEDHTLTVAPSAETPVIRLLLGEPGVQGLIDSPAEVHEAITVAIEVDGEAVETLTVAELLRRDAVLRASEVRIQQVGEMEVEGPGHAETIAEPLPTKVTWTCPYPGQAVCYDDWQYCLEEYECRGPDDPDDPACEECDNTYYDCVYGIYLGTSSTKQVWAGPFWTGQSRCAWYPWYKIFSPNTWEGFDVQYQIIDSEKYNCSGQIYYRQIGIRYEWEVCWEETGPSCSGGSYMDDCRL